MIYQSLAESPYDCETYAVNSLVVTATMLFAVFRFLYVENVTSWAAGALGFWVSASGQSRTTMAL